MANFLLAALLLCFPLSAHAYVNPEVGSLLYQAVIGGLLAAGATWKFFGRSIRDFFRRFR
jgi:hypothetical protein